jgi:uncharacterized membrane protein
MTVTQQALSTEGRGPAGRAALVRALAPALAYGTAVSVAVVAVAAGPGLTRNWRAISGALLRPPHAPEFSAIAHAPLPVQVHLATMCVAIACTAVLLAGVKGSRLHRVLGWTWSAAMLTTATVTLVIPSPPGMGDVFGLGYLHLFSLLTFISVPRAILAARSHQVDKHARIVSGFLIGGLGLAGLFAFLPGRLMWQVVFG